MNEQDYADSIVKMLGTLDVKTVYYIDDELEVAPAPARDRIFIALLKPTPPEIQQSLVELLPPSVIGSPQKQKRAALANHFKELDNENENILLNQLGQVLNIEAGVVLNPQAEFLAKLLGTRIGLECMGPVKWELVKTGVLSKANPTNRILFLFDQKLHSAGSGLGSSATTGMELIRSTIQLDNKKDTVFCILFSSDLQIENELTYWSDKVSEIGLESSQFFPLSKDRTNSNKLFAEGIKISSLNSMYDVLRNSTMHVIEGAAAEAKAELNRIHLHDLNSMVGISSRGEGVWEATTLIRLHEILRGDNIKKQMVDHNYASVFNKAVDKVIKIDKLFDFTPAAPDSIERYHLQPFQLRHRELYEDGKYLNATHSELKTGDIFRKSEDSQDFVLLAQPCDMVVRDDTGKRKSVVATLAPIKLFKSEEYDLFTKENPNYSKTIFLLENYNINGTDVGCVEFSNMLSVDMQVLDLAVLSKYGECSIDFSHGPECPPELHNAWKKRFKALIKDFKAIHERIQSIHKLCDKLIDEKDLVMSLIPNPYKTLTFNAQFTEPKFSSTATSLDYKLKRVTSIRTPVSNYLLDSYTKHLSRAAYDHNFSTNVKVEEKELAEN